MEIRKHSDDGGTLGGAIYSVTSSDSSNEIGSDSKEGRLVENSFSGDDLDEHIYLFRISQHGSFLPKTISQDGSLPQMLSKMSLCTRRSRGSRMRHSKKNKMNQYRKAFGSYRSANKKARGRFRKSDLNYKLHYHLRDRSHSSPFPSRLLPSPCYGTFLPTPTA